jgi:hypothetical protein
MTQNIRTSSFEYRSPTAVGKDHYKITISVKDLFYSDGKKYMDIGYEFEAVMETDAVGKLLKNHPFFHCDMDDFLEYDGEIIAKNPMTAMMVDYLLMDNAELAKFSGHTTPQDYKHKIMLSIVHFWD